MSEEPLFDPSLKKRKKTKKTVAFSEDPLGADADPTTPAPLPEEESTDLGPVTVHERMVQNGTHKEDGADMEDDFKAMFGDMKKKKKKKELPMDVRAMSFFSVAGLSHFCNRTTTCLHPLQEKTSTFQT